MFKVLQVIDRVEVGGAERVFLDLTKLLLDKNISVDTLCISAKGKQYDAIDSRANKIFLNRQNKYSLTTLWKCTNICGNYDIVHVHMRYTYFYIRLAQIICFKKFTIVFHDHYGDIGKDTSIPWSMKGFMVPKYYIGVSNTLYQWSLEQLKIPKNRAWLLKNTILPSKAGSIFPTTSNKNCLIVSNFRETKNIEFAIQLAIKMKKKLTIVGQHFQDNYSNRISNIIKTENNIEHIANERNVQSIMNNYSLALHTAKSESGPLVLMEYLAQGLPFVAFQTGEVAEVLREMIPQCFVDSFDEDKWIEAIQAIEKNPPQPADLTSLFEKYFGPENYINQCLAIYQQVENF